MSDVLVVQVGRMNHLAEAEPALMQTVLSELPGIDDELNTRIMDLGGVLASTTARSTTKPYLLQRSK